MDVCNLLECTGEFRNCEGENGNDFIGVAPLGLLRNVVSRFEMQLVSKSPDCCGNCVKVKAKHKSDNISIEQKTKMLQVCTRNVINIFLTAFLSLLNLPILCMLKLDNN